MTTCDIAAITKPWTVQLRAANLVLTEFFDQGDKERHQLKIQPQVIASLRSTQPGHPSMATSQWAVDAVVKAGTADWYYTNAVYINDQRLDSSTYNSITTVINVVYDSGHLRH